MEALIRVYRDNREEVSPDLRCLSFTGGGTTYADFGRVSSVDNLSTISALALVRVRALTSFAALLHKSATSTTGWRWTTDSAGSGMSFRFYRTSNTTYATNTSSGLVFPINVWRWVAFSADVSAGAGLKIAFFSSDVDQFVAPVTLGTLTEGSGAQTADTASNLRIGQGSSAQAGAMDVALVSLWTGRLTLHDFHEIQSNLFPTEHLQHSCLGFWRPGHDGQSSVPDLGPLRLNGAITGAQASSSGVTNFWSNNRSYKSSGATIFYVSLGGDVTPSGVLVRSVSKVLSGSSSPSGQMVKSVAKSLSGSTTLSGALSTLKVIIRSVSGSVSPSGSIVRQVTKILSGTTSISGVLIKSTTKLLSGSSTPSGAFSALKVIIRSFSGSVSVSGSIVRQVTKTLSGSATASGSIVKTVYKLTSGSVSVYGSLAKTITKVLSGSVSAVGAVVASALGTLSYPVIRMTAMSKRGASLVFTVAKGALLRLTKRNDT
jgi:hypothetical protein